MNRTRVKDMRGGGKPDYILGFVSVALVVVGLVAVASASSVQGFENFGDPYYFFKHQLFYGVIVGLAAMFISSNVNYEKWKRFAVWFLFASVLLLVAVFIPGLGTSYGTGASRWIALGPISIQPTEIVKLIFVVYLAAWFEKREKGIDDAKYGLVPFLVSLGIIAFLVILQPDLGTLVVIAGTAIVMYFVAGAPWKHIAFILAGAVGFFWLMVKIAPYRLARFTVFLHPELDPKGIGYQVNQALLAVGSGGLFGLGLGHSRQKFNYLPEAAGDSIFAVMAEELGLFRVLMIVGLFMVLAWRGFKIARETGDTFGKLLAVGITSWIILQAFVNIGALLSLIPLTGIPLPFISYGGSSIIFSLIGVGILLNISRYTDQRMRESKRSRFSRPVRGRRAVI